jgi:hypothetical protein
MPTNAEVGGPSLEEVPHATHGSALLGPQNNATLLACLAFGELPGSVIAIIGPSTKKTPRSSSMTIRKNGCVPYNVWRRILIVRC